ncbi:hypothetical protein Tco_1219066 [Tanacetum coccineum]
MIFMTLRLVFPPWRGVTDWCKRIKKSKRCNRKIRIPIAMWLCRVEEKMTLKEVDGQTVEEIKTKIIDKDGTITRVHGQFQGYENVERVPGGTTRQAT